MPAVVALAAHTFRAHLCAEPAHKGCMEKQDSSRQAGVLSNGKQSTEHMMSASWAQIASVILVTIARLQMHGCCRFTRMHIKQPGGTKHRDSACTALQSCRITVWCICKAVQGGSIKTPTEQDLRSIAAYTAAKLTSNGPACLLTCMVQGTAKSSPFRMQPGLEHLQIKTDPKHRFKNRIWALWQVRNVQSQQQ
jgi:hypothetical protein